MGKLYDSYRPFIDEWGLAHPTQGTISQNGIRFTAEMIYALKKNNELDRDLVAYYKKVLGRCFVADCTGLLKRHPFYRQNELQGMDDYIAIGLASKYVGYSLALDAILWGENHKYNYNNIDPLEFTFRSWLGRYPHLFAHLSFCVGLRPKFWHKIYWVLIVLGTALFADKKSQDPWVLTWMMVRGADKEKCFFVKIVRKFFSYKLKRAYANGIGDVIARYFGNPDHPSVLALKDEFGF